MKDGGSARWRMQGRWSPRNILLVSQMAAALTLLLITGILARGYQRAFAMDVGFNPNHLYTISLDPVRDGYSGAQATAFFENLLERLKRLPSVTVVSLSNTSPMWSPSASVTSSAAGSEPGSSPSIGTAERYAVGVGYFDTLGIPIQAGRGFRKDDETGGSAAVIVNERLARDFWKEQSPLGRRIEIGHRAFQVVGVTRPLRREIAAIDPNVMPFYGFRMVEQVDRLMYMSRIGVSIHTFDGVFGLILAMIGLAGMTAYSVAQRSREIGIRIALGAQKADILGLVMKEGAALVMIGGVFGGLRLGREYGCCRGSRLRWRQLLGAMSPNLGFGWLLRCCSASWRWTPAMCRLANRCASTRLFRCGRNKLGICSGSTPAGKPAAGRIARPTGR